MNLKRLLSVYFTSSNGKLDFDKCSIVNRAIWGTDKTMFGRLRRDFFKWLYNF